MQIDSSAFSALASINSMPPPPPPEGGENPLMDFIVSIDEEQGTVIENALINLSSEGQSAFKEALEAYKEIEMNATQDEREQQFLTILNDIFTQYDQDTTAIGILLSQYA